MVLPDQDKQAIKAILVEIIINYPEHTNDHAFYISKLNSTLISIVKYEWRTTW